MLKLRILFAIILFSNVINAQPFNEANTGTVKGIIVTSDGKPASLITVQIINTNWGSATDDKGEYTIRNVKPGTWILRVSAIGTIEQTKQFSISANETVQLDFTLNENAQQLQDVVVTTRNVNKETNTVAKMPLKNLENPQVYNVVSAELLKQQAISNYDDAFRNVPGITQTWQSTGRAGDGASYFALRGFDAQPSLTNGLPGLTSGNLDPADVEEIEVLKGPSGTLFGGSFYSYGGIINTITKKPYYDFGGELAYNFGSFGLNRLTADINTPLSKTEKIAMRVNAAFQTENSFQDAGFKSSFFIAPSFVYEVNNKLSFHVMAEILEEERAAPPVFFQSDRISPLPFKTVEALDLNPKLSFTSNELTIKNPRFNFQAQMLYKLSGQWTSQTVISRGTVKSNGIYTYIWDDVSGDEWFSQYFHNEQQSTISTDIQQNFNGDFRIGNLRNRLLIGLDYYNRNIIDNGSGWAWGRNVTPQGDINYVDPYTGDTLAPVYLSKASIDNLLAGTEVSNSNISNSSYSTYVSDVLNITPNILVMASLRADYFDSKGEKAQMKMIITSLHYLPNLGWYTSRYWIKYHCLPTI